MNKYVLTIFYFFVSILYFLPSLSEASADCAGYETKKEAIGKWHLKFDDKNFHHVKSLLISYSNGFFNGRIDLVSKDKIKGRACEGDCCDGFNNKVGTFNFDIPTKHSLRKIIGSRLTIKVLEMNWQKMRGKAQILNENMILIAEGTIYRNREASKF